MRFSTLMVLTTLIVMLAMAAGCTSSSPKGGNLTTPAETAGQITAVATTAVPVSTTAPVTTPGKCPSGQTPCADGTCRDTTSDHDACGGCGNVCPSGYVCKASTCVNPAATAAATETVTQGITVTTTAVPANPATTTVPTTTPAPQGPSRYSGSAIGNNYQQGIVTLTTSKLVDCSKYPITITSITPASGPKSGGTVIVVRGSGFTQAQYSYFRTCFGQIVGCMEPKDGRTDTEMVINSPKYHTTGTVDVQIEARIPGYDGRCLSPVTPAVKFTYV